MSNTSITRPLNLAAHLRAPDRTFDPVPWINLLVLFVFVGLLQSRFLLAPGVTIDLPSQTEASLGAVQTTAVLTMSASGLAGDRPLILFQGKALNLDQIEGPLTDFVRLAKAEETLLLLKADRNVRAQHLITLCEIARRAGFGGVQLAAEDAVAPTGPQQELRF